MAEAGPLTLVAHADWSVDRRKRWVSVANHRDGTWRAAAPEPVGDPTHLLQRLRERAGGGAVLVGFDFPIGLPEAYARTAGIRGFPDFLNDLGPEADFWHVCETAREIPPTRPFYPQRPGGTRQAHLVAGLRVQSIDDLRRRCERATPLRRAACPLFWTLGGNQVGKAAIGGWRQVIAPALTTDTAQGAGLWPFNGTLADLIRPGRAVLAETYPAEFYRRLRVQFGGPGNGKRSQIARRENAETLRRWAEGAGLVLAPAAESQLCDGYGPGSDGEDRFDAAVGRMGMLNLVLGLRPCHEPDDPAVRTVEGWILGQAGPAP